MRSKLLQYAISLSLLTWLAFSMGCAQPAAQSPTPTSPAAAPKAPVAPATPATSAPSAAQSSPRPAVSPTSGSSTGQGLTTLKIAHAPSTLFAPLYVAIDRGYLREEGIGVDLSVVPAGQDAMAFVATGQLDAAVAGIASATFNAVNRGLDIRIVASMGESPEKGDPSALMVRSDLLKGGAVKGPADLKGKKIAIAGGLGATSSYYLAAILQPAGLTLKDVEGVNMAFPDMIAAFKNKSIDAAIPPAPFSTQIANDGLAEIPAFGHLKPHVSGVGVVFGPRLLREKPELGQKLMAALVKGARDIQGDKFYDPKNLEIFSKYTKQKVQQLKDMPSYNYRRDLAPDVETYQNMQKAFIQAGLLSYSEPLPTDKVVDDRFVRFAAQKLGQ